MKIIANPAPAPRARRRRRRQRQGGAREVRPRARRATEMGRNADQEAARGDRASSATSSSSARPSSPARSRSRSASRSASRATSSTASPGASTSSWRRPSARCATRRSSPTRRARWRSASATSRSASSPTSRPGTIRTSSAATSSCPALAAGNAVLYKPSEFATLTGMHIADMLHAAGVPDDVFIAVIGDGKTGTALLRQPVDGVFFTGSYRDRREDRRQHRPAHDQDAARARRQGSDLRRRRRRRRRPPRRRSPTARSTTRDSRCCSVERVYVHADIYDEFVDAFVAEVKGFKVGDPLDESTYIGADHAASRSSRCCEKQVADAKKKGARLLTGRRADQGHGQLVRADGARRRRPLDARDARRDRSARSSGCRRWPTTRPRSTS